MPFSDEDYWPSVNRQRARERCAAWDYRGPAVDLGIRMQLCVAYTRDMRGLLHVHRLILPA